MFLLPILLIFLLASAAGLLLGRRRFNGAQPDSAAAVILAVMMITSLAWLIAGWRLPLVVTVSHWPVATQLGAWRLIVDDVAWLLSGLLLLVVTATAVVNFAAAWRHEPGQSDHVEPEPGRAAPEAATSLAPLTAEPAALLLVLTAGGLVTLWAESLAGVMVGWTSLAIAWLLLLVQSGPGVAFHPAGENGPAAGTDEQRDSQSQATAGFIGQLAPRLGLMLLSLFFLWLAAATSATAATPVGWLNQVGQWPVVSLTCLLIAATLQMGVFPLHFWRPISWPTAGRPAPGRHMPASVAALIHIVPALAGASLLYRLLSGSSVALGYSLPLTAFGLLGLLIGAAMAWSLLDTPVRATAALSLAHAGLALLAGVWAGPGALLAETRVMALAVAVMFLAPRLAAAQLARRPWLAVGPALALAALAGLPLTAGFLGRAALYHAWLDNGRFILVLVSALLHIPLVTVSALLLWRPAGPSLPAESDLPAEGRPSTGRWPWPPVGSGTWPSLAYGAGLLLPALALLIPGPSLGPFNLFVWPAILLPPVMGLVLLYYLPEAHEAQMALQQTVRFDLPLGQLVDSLSRVFTYTGTAVREAAAILEGEGGLLWLLIMLALFWLAWAA
jgi:formate hydrogenlyase subunit 3/multisubunit Na+/H+ antiporter MnhD subunit